MTILKGKLKSTLCIVVALREMCLYLELFWSVFSRIRAKYGDLSTNIQKILPGILSGEQEHEENA